MSNNIKSLSLYHFKACPYCIQTRKAISTMGLDVELKDIRRQHVFRAELLKQGGQLQVPCLRIEKLNGQTEWLYESRKIIHFLDEHQLETIDVA